ncbi:hypothetical protein GF420_02605 [candidate division GN15 bacterium]|nr:hypothetical protein [candidate division GN15 bacterium]
MSPRWRAARSWMALPSCLFRPSRTSRPTALFSLLACSSAPTLRSEPDTIITRQHTGNTMYRLETSVRLHDTDAAGLLFFAHQLKIAHDAYESFLESAGLTFQTILTERDYLLAIVHAESDYLRTLEVGQFLTVEVSAARVGSTSFTLTYTITSDGETVGTAQTVHVCIDRATREKRPLPEELRSILSKLQTA